jgi:ABC-type glutathione transport system ATPase component
MPEPLLEVNDLQVCHAAPVLNGVSFAIAPGTIAGLFGESGSGKTTLALAIPGLLSRERYRVSGSVRLAGRELLGLSEPELRRVRGASVSLILQDPMLALNPVLRVGFQVREAMRAHGIAAPVEPLLETVGLEPSRRLLRAYPHQLSGGERQRVTIAQALACRPALVIADEPFTALDLLRVVELAALFEDLKRRTGTAFLLISHSPGVLARLADTVLVLDGGRIVEQGAPAAVFRTPRHPYTVRVLEALRDVR